MRQLLLVLALVTTAYAQAPSQFSDLLTTSTDHTADAGVWTAPARPDWGSTYTDPTWGTTIKRIQRPGTPCVDSTYNCYDVVMIPYYSKKQIFNADSSKFLILDKDSYFHLYNADGTWVRKLTDTGTGSQGGLCCGREARWSTTDPHTIYWITSTATGANAMSLRKYIFSSDYSTGTASTIHQFACDDGAGHACTKLWQGDGEGNPSEGERYWSLVGQYYDGANFQSVTVWIYDMQTDTVVTQKPWNELCYQNSCTSGINWIGMSPSGNYVLVDWNLSGSIDPSACTSTSPPSCFETNNVIYGGRGVGIYDRSLTYLRMGSWHNGHNDIGYDVNGDEVLVFETADPSLVPIKKYTVSSVRLSDGRMTNQYVPCTHWYSTTDCSGGQRIPNPYYHVSMRGTMKAGTRGWALWSTYPSTGSTEGGGWGAAEIYAVKIDNAAANLSAATFYRISRTFSIRNANYNAEPHATTDPNFRYIVWGSGWLDTETATTSPVSAYMIDLGEASPPAATTGVTWGNVTLSGVTVQ